MDFADTGGEETIAKLEAQARSGDDVGLNDTASPGTPINANFMWGQALLVEPATPDPILAATEDPDSVSGISGGDDDAIALAQVGFANGVEFLRVCNQGLQGVHWRTRS